MALYFHNIPCYTIYIYIYVIMLYIYIFIIFIYLLYLLYHIIFIIYIVYLPLYPARGGTETMREYLQTRSDKLISSNSLRDLASITLNNNHFENEELKYHQKRAFATGT